MHKCDEACGVRVRLITISRSDSPTIIPMFVCRCRPHSRSQPVGLIAVVAPSRQAWHDRFIRSFARAIFDFGEASERARVRQRNASTRASCECDLAKNIIGTMSKTKTSLATGERRRTAQCPATVACRCRNDKDIERVVYMDILYCWLQTRVRIVNTLVGQNVSLYIS